MNEQQGNPLLKALEAALLAALGVLIKEAVNSMQTPPPPTEGAGRSIDHARVTDRKPPGNPCHTGWFSSFDTFFLQGLEPIGRPSWQSSGMPVSRPRGNRWSSN